MPAWTHTNIQNTLCIFGVDWPDIFLSLQKPATSSCSLLFCVCPPFPLWPCLLALFVTLPLKIFTFLLFLCYPVPGQTLNPTPSLQHWAASTSTEALVLTAQFFFPFEPRNLFDGFQKWGIFPYSLIVDFVALSENRGKCHWVPFPGSTPVCVWPPSCCPLSLGFDFGWSDGAPAECHLLSFGWLSSQKDDQASP